jgi:hypothetical protein
MVCSGGACVACSSGAPCTPPNPCHTGSLSCEGGTPVCDDTGGNVPNGTTCGTNLRCENGTCCGIYEICDNGVDDDCDGLVDCADPQCTADGGTNGQGQWACAALPSGNGWSIVAFDPGAQPACPASFAGGQKQVLGDLDGGTASCSCQCTPQKAASCSGRFAWATNGTGSSCPGRPTSGGNALEEGVCLNNSGDNLNQSWDWIGQGNSLATVPGSCGAKGVISAHSVTDEQGETCALPQAGGGCGASAACVPIAPSGFQLCAVHAGVTTCPTGLVPSTVYAGYVDGRVCSSCSCETPANINCTLTSATFYTGSNCGSTQGNCTISGSCAKCNLGNGTGDTNSMQGNFGHDSNAGTCTQTAPSLLDGGVTGSSATTVCCVP